MNYGATPEEWNHFAYTLDLESELLPVVSDPTKSFAKKSKIKRRGKVPSKLNLRGEIVGVVDWPKFIANDLNIQVWEKKGYGLCIQTRKFIGFDIDCEDRVITDLARRTLWQVLSDSGQTVVRAGDDGSLNYVSGSRIYYRGRPNSNRCLLPVTRLGEFSFKKLVLNVYSPTRQQGDEESFGGGEPCGIIEVLGDGNQFIGCASHYSDGIPSGTRYEWREGVHDGIEFPGNFPGLDEAAVYLYVASLIAALEAAGFHVEPVSDGRRRIARYQGGFGDGLEALRVDGAHYSDLRTQAQAGRPDDPTSTAVGGDARVIPWEDESATGDNEQVRAGQRLHAQATGQSGAHEADAGERDNAASEGAGNRGHARTTGNAATGAATRTDGGDTRRMAGVDEGATAGSNRQPENSRGSGGASSARKTVDRGVRDDPLAARIRETSFWRRDAGNGYGNKGELTLWCPYKGDHTSDNGPSETVYFPAQPGHPRGVFKCLHAHCAGYTFEDYLVKMGMSDFVVDFSDEAEDLTALAKEGEGEKVITPSPSAARNTNIKNASVQDALPPDAGLERNKQLKYVSTISNLKKAISYGTFYHPLAYCTFRCTVMVKIKGQWEPFTDEDYTECRNIMEIKQFEYIKKEDLKDVIRLVASRNQIDTAQLWLNGLTWDGKDRITDFFRNWFGGAELDTPRGEYETAVAHYMWTALAGRTLQPGVQADMVPLLIGEGGARKSSAVRALVPDFRQFGNIKISQDADTVARKLQGVRVAELGELRGFAKVDSQDIKDFITAPWDSWIPKFKEYPKEVPRRCLFVGTTDQQQVLYDTANNFRRWLPVKVSAIDVDSISKFREQLWAQGAHEFLLGGVAFEKAERLAIPFLEEHKEEDPWVPVIRDWIEERTEVELGVVMIGALGFSHISSKRSDQLRVGKILRSLGFENKVVFRNQKSVRLWVKAEY